MEEEEKVHLDFMPKFHKQGEALLDMVTLRKKDVLYMK